MKERVALAAICLYAIGLCSTHAQLMRYGIVEIAPLELSYVIVATHVLLSVVPAIWLIVLLEARLSNRLMPRQVAVAAGGMIPVALVLVILAWRFELAKLLFNFIAYPYPRWYIPMNLLWGNALLFFSWILLLVAARKRLLPSRYCGYGLAVPLLLYAVVFGRTILPAIDRAVGGGAPECVEVLNGATTVKALLVHQSATSLYLLPLEKFPSSRASRLTSLVGAAGPVRQAYERNRVLVLPSDSVQSISYVNLSYFNSIVRYLDKGRHWLPE